MTPISPSPVRELQGGDAHGMSSLPSKFRKVDQMIRDYSKVKFEKVKRPRHKTKLRKESKNVCMHACYHLSIYFSCQYTSNVDVSMMTMHVMFIFEDKKYA